MRHFLIDTDTASDDAVALVMALSRADVVVEAITVVGGNVPVDQGVQNALYTVELTGQEVAVHRGEAKPMRRELQTAEHVHGRDGMGDIGLPLVGRTPASTDAVGAIIETIHRFPGELTIVTLGPLTNIARAVQRDPSIVGLVGECVVMGGIGRGPGNITPVAEFNIWVDPDAAKIVFESGLPIKMVGWDPAHAHASMDDYEIERLRAVGTPLAEFCVDIQKTLHEFCIEKMHLPGFDLPDPLAVAVALDPSVVTETKRMFVAIETESELCRGQTVVDHLGVTGEEPNVDLVFEVSRQRFLELLHEAVK